MSFHKETFIDVQLLMRRFAKHRDYNSEEKTLKIKQYFSTPCLKPGQLSFIKDTAPGGKGSRGCSP